MKRCGFTVIEVMVVTVIVAILTIIAMALYTPQELRGRRIDGVNAILAIALAEERYRSTNTQYGTLAQAYNSVTASPEGYYTLSVSGVTASTYTITATAQGNQANDAQSGTSCATLQLAVSNGTSTKTPAVCWPS